MPLQSGKGIGSSLLPLVAVFVQGCTASLFSGFALRLLSVPFVAPAVVLLSPRWFYGWQQARRRAILAPLAAALCIGRSKPWRRPGHRSRVRSPSRRVVSDASSVACALRAFVALAVVLLSPRSCLDG